MGLLFVVVTIGSSLSKSQSVAGIRAFSTPTVEDQIIVEVSDAPFTKRGELRSAQRKRRTHLGVFAQGHKARLGAFEESNRHRVAGVFCEIHVMLHEVAARRGPLADLCPKPT